MRADPSDTFGGGAAVQTQNFLVGWSGKRVLIYGYALALRAPVLAAQAMMKKEKRFVRDSFLVGFQK
jgi:hypothetical protein